MSRVVITMDDELLARVDRAAQRLGLSRSAYLVQLAAKDVGMPRDARRQTQVREALLAIDRLFAENPTPGETTAFIREMRDSR